MMADPDRFGIPVRPTRTIDGETVEASGEVVFKFIPADPSTDIRSLVSLIFETEGYIAGDWFGLPEPVYLVHDEVIGDVFRVRISGHSVEFMVLPSTTPPSIERFYDRLRSYSSVPWDIERRVTPPEDTPP